MRERLVAIFQCTFRSNVCRLQFLYLALCQVFGVVGPEIEVSRNPAEGIVNGTHGGNASCGPEVPAEL